MSPYREIATFIGTTVDGLGIIVIFVGALIATIRFVFHRYGQPTVSYQAYRQDLGRAILLGLEFLIAGDIIKTIIIAPTMHNVLLLGIIVLIRTFLSTSLQLELEGRWPWQPPTQVE